MGKLIKNHLARLIVLTAATYQVAAAVEGYFWPKIFWDFRTEALDGAVKPIPVLQTINLVFALFILALEWPLGFIAGSTLHCSLEFRLAILPLTAVAAALMYQATNSAVYYLIGVTVYFCAYSEGERICAKPWTLPHGCSPKDVRAGETIISETSNKPQSRSGTAFQPDTSKQGADFIELLYAGLD